MELLGFPKRVMGVEVEYWLDEWNGDNLEHDYESNNRRQSRVNELLGHNSSRKWLEENGGCVYRDVGYLPEANTPEVTGGWEAVVYDRALEAYLTDRALGMSPVPS